MKDATLEGLGTHITPYLPKRFQEGKLPYLFLIIWFVIAVMVALSVIAPYPEPIPAPLKYVAVLLVLQLMFIWGMPLKAAVHLALGVGLIQVGHAAWTSGGIYSPRMAWIPLIPLIPYYSISRRSGWIWFALVLLLEALMAYMTHHASAPQNQSLDSSYALASYASYSVVMVMIITVPYVYDRLFRNAHAASLQRNVKLEEKRKELIRTSLLREQFIATVSHELRTPMNVILGFNNILMMRTQDNPQALKILNHTKQSAEHLLTVINDVLDYSQLQAGKIKIHPEIFGLRDTIHAAFELFAQRVESMHLTYRCEIADDVPQWVFADKHRLMQILVNLLGNAIKFTHQGSVILSVKQQTQGVYFAIEDTGIGIAKSQQERIFQRFSQADEHIQSRYGGNGLGLSITQSLVELMGGRIGFDSEETKGSLFWFTLPLAEAQPPQIQAKATPRVEATTDTNQRFLVVDDHPINRLLVRQILQSRWHNCEIVEADDGAKALTAIQTQDFDVVLMDMVMPQMDGIEATAALRELAKPKSDIPVLGLTANVNPHDLERFTAAGLNGVLLKPFDANQVCDQVEAMIKAKKSSLGS